MKFVLEKLIHSLFTSHHIFTFLISELTIFSRTFRSRTEAKTFVKITSYLLSGSLCKSGPLDFGTKIIFPHFCQSKGFGTYI